MATRTQKWQECDRAGYRNRVGVRKYELVLKAMSAQPNVTYDCVVATAHGELCHAHENMVGSFMGKLFKNTKQYDEPDGKDAPSGMEA